MTKCFMQNPLTHMLCSLLLVTLSLLSGCGRELSDAELLQRDKDELSSMLNTNKILSYKFVKLCARASQPADVDTPEMRAFKVKANGIASRSIFLDSTRMASPGLLDFIEIYRDYLELKDFVIRTDEDIFPPLAYQHMRLHSTNPDSIKANKLIVQSTEHAFLSVLVLTSRDLGKPIALYESAQTEPEFLPDGEAKTLLRLLRGFIFFEKGLNYLAEDELSGNLKWLEAHPGVDLPYSAVIFQWEKGNANLAHTGLHAMNLLMRGIDRLMMERDIDGERALADFDAFLLDAEKMGLDNELTWVIGAYVAMKKEEHRKAILYLNKLRLSPVLGDGERESIDETIAYLQEREAGKALNGVYDNVFIGKVVVKYSFALLMRIDWRKLMIDNDIPAAEEAFATADRIQAVINGIDKYTSTETLVELEKGVEEKVVEESKGLVDKVKSWWE